MPSYFVSYDLRKYRDYDALYTRLNSISDAVRPLESVWIIPSYASAESLRRFLDPALDMDDGLIVWELGRDCSLKNPDNPSNALALGMGSAAFRKESAGFYNALATFPGLHPEPEPKTGNVFADLLTDHIKRGL
jgi:hypothetical protein